MSFLIVPAWTQALAVLRLPDEPTHKLISIIFVRNIRQLHRRAPFGGSCNRKFWFVTRRLFCGLSSKKSHSNPLLGPPSYDFLVCYAYSLPYLLVSTCGNTSAYPFNYRKALASYFILPLKSIRMASCPQSRSSSSFPCSRFPFLGRTTLAKRRGY